MAYSLWCLGLDELPAPKSLCCAVEACMTWPQGLSTCRGSPRGLLQPTVSRLRRWPRPLRIGRSHGAVQAFLQLAGLATRSAQFSGEGDRSKAVNAFSKNGYAPVLLGVISISGDGLQDAFFPLLGNLSQFHIFCSTPLPEEFGESSVE